jgi:serine/threonine protein kinase
LALTQGTRLGPYEILSAIGAGGMGEVYKARDTRLDRDVAIKILPEAFAADADRVARFQREAKTLAVLNHPNIAQIFGLHVLRPVQHTPWDQAERRRSHRPDVSMKTAMMRTIHPQILIAVSERQT